MGETSRLQCDLVMRGGITSGIVYPKAIAKLAETYDFRCIGGTSAGAIAATATAAAQLGRARGKDHFQTRIKGLPGELAEGEEEGRPSVLQRLFQPQPGMRRLFNVLMAGLGRDRLAIKLLKLCGALLVNYWPYAIAGAALLMLPFFLLAYLTGLGGLSLTILLIVGFLPALILVLLGTLVGVVWDILHRLPENGYGLCSGSSHGKPDKTGILPLTDWLHELFQNVANRPLNKPVTFGDLWGTKDPTKDRRIELALMTTNITRGISQRFPFLEGSWGQLFFKKKDFEALFPHHIVRWMIKKENLPKIQHEKEIAVPKSFYPLPNPADLPILVGARMSLSFPFLLSAVPLYAVDFETKKVDGKFPLKCCWFSDGGLTSNFPIHFFDAPLPSRPTFGINLIADTIEATEVEETHGRLTRISGTSDQGQSRSTQGADWEKVWMPNKNASGIGSAARFRDFSGIIGFFSALFDTARNWGDTELMAMPGYRDRIVHVSLAEDEGGLNLNMPSYIIEAVGSRGERAGELLAARFSPEPGKDPKTDKDIELTWDNHRWVRFRAFMAALEMGARRMQRRWDASGLDSSRSYETLLDRAQGENPKSYPFRTNEQRQFVRRITKDFVKAVAAFNKDFETFDRWGTSAKGGAPRPKPVLRLMPAGHDPKDERA